MRQISCKAIKVAVHGFENLYVNWHFYNTVYSRQLKFGRIEAQTTGIVILVFQLSYMLPWQQGYVKTSLKN